MLQHFLDEFLAKVPLQLPRILDTTNMLEPQHYEDFILLTFSPTEDFDLEEVMDMFEDDMELIMLYHHVPSRTSSFGHSTCAYSNPAFGQMFKMNAQTNNEGRVKNIHVTLYDSLEIMYGDLCLELSLHEKDGSFKYVRTKDNVMIDFL